MTALEQVLDCFCPLVEQEVQIRIIYYCSNTRTCQINSEPAFYECLLSENCGAYLSKEPNCLLCKFNAGENSQE
ncbi:MAG: hypothetical protein GX119_04065 [Syntrophomonadaceae bacterium]|jgi:hypothetical protein|nr:hypothetical protein [Syntrophomonadaceae bacterium]